MAVVYRLPKEEMTEQCQYVYWYLMPNGQIGRCKRYAGYRVGRSIYLCGQHCPGVNRASISDKPPVGYDSE